MRNRKIKNPRYDQNCGSLGKQFTPSAKLLQKHPKGLYVIEQYKKVKKAHRTATRTAKRNREERNTKKSNRLE